MLNVGIFVILFGVFLSHLPSIECASFSCPVFFVVVSEACKIKVGGITGLYVYREIWLAGKSPARVQKFLSVVLPPSGTIAG